ncbi:MAG: helix-turn-helix domain-containing protein [Janthinobacterium lividum]
MAGNPTRPARHGRYAQACYTSSTTNFRFHQVWSKRGRMISIAQIRAARGLLKWTQAMLAHRASVSTVTLNMIENESVRPRETTLAAIRRALESGGVQFLEEDGVGVGVRFAPSELSRRKASLAQHA